MRMALCGPFHAEAGMDLACLRSSPSGLQPLRIAAAAGAKEV